MAKSFIAPAPVAAFSANREGAFSGADCALDGDGARDQVRALTVRGAMTGADSSVELYLTEDGTLIRLENADQCEPLRYACLLE